MADTIPALEECQDTDLSPSTATALTPSDSATGTTTIPFVQSSASSASVSMKWEERFTQLGYRMFMRELQLEREYQLALQRYKGYKHFRNRVLGAVENEADWKQKYNQGQLKKFSSAICPPLESKKAPKICVDCKQNPREDGKMGEVPCGVAVTRPISTWATNHVEKVKKEHYFFDTKPVTKDSMEVSYQVVDVVPSEEKWVKWTFNVEEDGQHVKTITSWFSEEQERAFVARIKAVDLLRRAREVESPQELVPILMEGRNLLDASPDCDEKQELLQEWERIMTQLASLRLPTQEPREEAQEEKGCSD